MIIAEVFGQEPPQMSFVQDHHVIEGFAANTPNQPAVRVHVAFTLLMFAFATAYRLACAREATGGELVGWQCWRRPLLEPTRSIMPISATSARTRSK
jgi:hypothetical protein